MERYNSRAMRIGLLSDTHGLLRPRVLELLAGCDRIFHAGDVGSREILARLEMLTPGVPVAAVRGNTDGGELADLPDSATFEIEGMALGLIHRREDVPARWQRSMRVVAFGHSHRPEIEWRSEALWINPGACGARRFRLPLTLALLTLDEGRIVPEIFAVE